MKKLLLILSLSSLLIPARAGVQGTPHDFTTERWGAGRGSCTFCHTPHGAQNITGAPLWNRTSTTTQFKTYASDTMHATTAQPGPTSLLCEGCHDGTIAVDTLAGGKPGTEFIDGEKAIGHGGDLTKDHPIAFTYDSSLAAKNPGLVLPASTRWVDGGNKIPLFAGKLECASCHSVHDNTLGNFLRVGNDKSQICLQCHLR